MLLAEDGELAQAEQDLTALIEMLEQELVAKAKEHDSPSAYELCRCLINRAAVCNWAVKPREAMRDLERAEFLANQEKEFIRRGLLINVLQDQLALLSSAFSPLYDTDLARTKIAALRAEEPDGWMIATAEMRLAQQEHDWQQVIAQAEIIMTSLGSLGFVRGVNGARNAAARAWLALGHHERAEPLASEAWAFFEKNGPPEFAAQSALALARARGCEQDWALAEEALKLTEQFVRAQRGVFNQQRVLVEKLQVFGDALRFALHLVEVARTAGARRTAVARAWEVAERSKSFSLRQAMTQGGWLQTLAPKRAAALAEMDERLDALEAQRDNPEAVKTLLRLNEERGKLIEAAMAESPQVAMTSTAPALEIQALLDTLPSNTGVVSWYWLKEADGWQLHIFYAGANREAQHMSTRWSADQVTSVDSARRHLVTARPFEVKETMPASLAEKVFPGQLLSALAGCETLLLTPHRHLRQMPLHAARVSDGTGSSWLLIERYAVQVLPTLALPFPAQTASSNIRKVLLMGCARDNFVSPALGDVPLELQTLQKTWESSGQSVSLHLLTQYSRLDKHAPLSSWPQFDVIHLACHGSFVPQRPLDAALLLGSEKLRATEFFNTTLNARVICLSACDVGQHADTLDGLELVGDEWLGLALPLFQSGARTILASLWQANSQTAREFMQTFHGQLASGATTARAHQVACLNQIELRRPLGFWANWQLAGFPG